MLTYDDALRLKRVADGEAMSLAPADRDRLTAAGLIRVLAEQDVADIRAYTAATAQATAAREQYRKALHLSGPEQMAEALLPKRRDRHEHELRALQVTAGELEHNCVGLRDNLAERDLLRVDLTLTTYCGADSFVQTTRTGRLALLGFVHSAAASPGADVAQDRAQRFVSMRHELVDLSNESECRLDLAGAILVGHATDSERFRALNHLAAGDNWQDDDRLPLLAALCSFEGDAESVWAALVRNQAFVTEHGDTGGYRAAFVAAMMMGRCSDHTIHDIDEVAIARTNEIGALLQTDGWTLAGQTDPVSATLSRACLLPADAVARSRWVTDELHRGRPDSGTHFGYVSVALAASNLYPVDFGESEADGANRILVLDEFTDRYDALVAGLPEQQRTSLAPALLALAPGTTADNLAAFTAISSALAGEVGVEQMAPVAVALACSRAPEWFDISQHAWALACTLPLDARISGFGADQHYPRYSYPWAGADLSMLAKYYQG